MTQTIYDRRVFLKGKNIIREGDVATSAYLIQSGKVGVYRDAEGDEHQIATVGQGEVVGEMALIGRRNHRCTVRTLEETVVYVITPELLEKKMNLSDPLVKMILEGLVYRLDLYAQDTPAAS